MVNLDFAIEGVEIERYAAEPSILFSLRAENRTLGTTIQNVALACQIRIEAARRRYSREEQERLSELFGEGYRFESALRSMLWTQTSLQLPAFETECIGKVPVECSFDLDVAAVKYFYGLENGEAQLSFLFSGTVFYLDPDGYLQMEPIPWSKEAHYRLPVAIWREAIGLHYPNSVWLRIDRSLFDEIYELKRRHGFTSFQDTIRSLLHPRQRERVS